MRKHAELHEAIKSTASTGYIQGIRDFLAKPIPVKTFYWTTSDTQNQIVSYLDIATELMAQAVWTDKLRGFLNFSATAVVRLQANANPFQQGMLLGYFLPQYKEFVAASAIAYPVMHASLQNRSQCPNVKLDARDTEAIIRIPYVAPTSFYDLHDGRYDWGRVSWAVYAPLLVGAAQPNSVECTVWLSFEDVELLAPAYKAPQSDTANQRRGARFKKVGTMIAEQKQGATGPITSVLGTVAKVADSLSDVPLLSSIATPVAWVSDMAAGVASMFGWSKPIQEGAPIRVTNNLQAYSQNYNGLSLALPTSLALDNKVSVLPGFAGTDLDEMSINFVKSVPSYFMTTSWTISQVQGTTLMDHALTPSLFQVTHTSVGSTHTLTSADMTPVAFLGHLYRYYRGSLGIRMRFPKTQFHSGRLAVAYYPGNNVSGVTGLAPGNYVHRAVIDLRESNEFTFVMPYSMNLNYLPTNAPYGHFTVTVLNELRAPTTVNNTIDIICEVFGAEDLEFEFPRTDGMYPLTGIQMGDHVPSPAVESGSIRQLDTQTLGDSRIVGDSGSSAEYCIGERSVSLLQLCKRSMRTNIEPPIGSNKDIYLSPFLNGCATWTASASFLELSTFSQDYLNLISSLYAYSRGGVTFRTNRSDVHACLLSTKRSNVLSGAGIANTSMSSTASNPAFLSDTGLTGQVIQLNSEGGAVTVPHYGLTYLRLNHRYSVYNANQSVDPSVPYLTLRLSLETADTAIFRAAADDFQLGFFTGVPPMVLSIVANPP